MTKLGVKPRNKSMARPKAKGRVGHRDWDLVGTSLDGVAILVWPEIKGLGFEG